MQHQPGQTTRAYQCAQRADEPGWSAAAAGEWAIVGGNSQAIRSVKAGATVYGVPAATLKSA